MKSIFKLSVLALLLISVSCQVEPVENISLKNVSNLQDNKDDDECETAFGYSADNCFLNYGFNRWGWVIGPLSEGTVQDYEMYAGAGQCNIANGELVGLLSISYVGGTVSVNYDAFGLYGWTETHLYVGNEMFPQKPNGQLTVAPGQYGNQNSFDAPVDMDDYIIEDVSGDIYIIAHAVVCEEEEPKKCDIQLAELKTDEAKLCLDDQGFATLSAYTDGSEVIPEGYEIVYVLTTGSELIIIDVNTEPSFVVEGLEGDFRIHSLIYDPLTLNLEDVVLGETSGFDVYNLTIEAGGDICAALDTKGVLFGVVKCDF